MSNRSIKIFTQLGMLGKGISSLILGTASSETAASLKQYARHSSKKNGKKHWGVLDYYWKKPVMFAGEERSHI